MCGIIGYTGARPCAPMLIEGLKRLEYRGYDSAGIGGTTAEGILSVKQTGHVSELEQSLDYNKLLFTTGVGHTRWATHGQATNVNAHPHLDSTGTFAVVHNGIIENAPYLRETLEQDGVEFRSETDSEVIAHLVAKYYDGQIDKALTYALAQIQGTYGLCVLTSHEPNKIACARQGSPLIISFGKDEFFIASDITAIVAGTAQAIYLKDGECALVTPETYDLFDSHRGRVTATVEDVDYTADSIDKGDYDSFMLKEICEQPQVVRDTMRGRLNTREGISVLGGLAPLVDFLHQTERIIITACGTSWHAGLIGEYMIEQLSGIPVETDYASEFRYRNPVITPRTLVIVITQSGETADTLAALREAKVKGAKVIAINNVVGSSIARESDAGVYLHAGPEIGVASTKAITTQMTVLAMIAIMLGRMRHIGIESGATFCRELERIPPLMKAILADQGQIKTIAEKYKDAANMLYLGRGYNFPVALEGALKLKEISYIHAEGYPAAEMKHGPIALIDRNMPVVVIATRDSTYNKVVSNIEEVRSRQGKVFAIASEGDTELAAKVDDVFYVPETLDFLMPLLTVIPLQLFAYHIATMKGCNVDKPRNLAKSVTVE